MRCQKISSKKRGCDRSDQLQEIRRNLRKLLLLFLIWLVLFPQRQAFDSHYEQGDVTQILSHLLFLSLDQKFLYLILTLILYGFRKEYVS